MIRFYALLLASFCLLAQDAGPLRRIRIPRPQLWLAQAAERRFGIPVNYEEGPYQASEVVDARPEIPASSYLKTMMTANTLSPPFVDLDLEMSLPPADAALGDRLLSARSMIERGEGQIKDPAYRERFSVTGSGSALTISPRVKGFDDRPLSTVIQPPSSSEIGAPAALDLIASQLTDQLKIKVHMVGYPANALPKLSIPTWKEGTTARDLLDQITPARPAQWPGVYPKMNWRFMYVPLKDGAMYLLVVNSVAQEVQSSYGSHVLTTVWAQQP